MHVVGQKRLLLMPSTIRPRARSLSATIARGVGQPGLVPQVWSAGRLIVIRCGIAPCRSNAFRSARIRSVRETSGMVSGKYGYVGCVNGAIRGLLMTILT